MKKIYLVIGSTGEYDDYDEWVVKAFRRKKLALALANKAKARANELYPVGRLSYRTSENKFDPACRMARNGASYVVAEVSFDDK
jgi:hypothetical protein